MSDAREGRYGGCTHFWSLPKTSMGNFASVPAMAHNRRGRRVVVGVCGMRRRGGERLIVEEITRSQAPTVATPSHHKHRAGLGRTCKSQCASSPLCRMQCVVRSKRRRGRVVFLTVSP